MLRLEDIHTYYGESHVLQGVSIEVSQGKVVALLGRNGMGKTTTLHSIAGFLTPSKGSILFNGINICRKPAHSIVKSGIALIPQGRRIFKSLTVRENLIIGSYNHRDTEKLFSLEEVYELFPVLRKKANQMGDQLSGGEQQMLAIGRALMTNPELILMDEPFEGLAPTIVKEIRQVIHELKDKGITILLVEQNLPAALRIADYIYVMNKGRIAIGNTPENFRENQDTIRQYLTL